MYPLSVYAKRAYELTLTTLEKMSVKHITLNAILTLYGLVIKCQFCMPWLSYVQGLNASAIVRARAERARACGQRRVPLISSPAITWGDHNDQLACRLRAALEPARNDLRARTPREVNKSRCAEQK
eukprot:1507764-Pleurochrysis_carterae.AAC.2